MPIRIRDKAIGNEVILGSDGAIYLGNPNTNGTWKIVINGNDLEFQKRESGVFVMKGAMQP